MKKKECKIFVKKSATFIKSAIDLFTYVKQNAKMKFIS